MIPMAGEKKEQLREKLIGFQRKIADLKRKLDRQEQDFSDRETQLLSGFFEVMDAFEILEANLESKKESLDKPARMMKKNIQSISKKLYRTFTSNGIEQIRFKEGEVDMTQCKIIDTRQNPDLPEETLLEIVKNGYINTRDDKVLRKAEVITVRNSGHGP